MGPNPALGTNTGQTYIGREGEGVAPIFGPSRAADTYVTMRREQLAFERQTQAAQAAQAQVERNKAKEKLMAKPEYYVKYNDEVITELEAARDAGAELIAQGLDPWAPSKDPAVKAFQKQWDDVQLIAQTSKVIEKFDTETRSTLTAKGAQDEYDVEGFVAERDQFLNRSLKDIAKDIDNIPSPKDRYGVVKAASQLSTYVKTITGNGEVPTEQQLYDAAVAFAADPTNTRAIDALMKKDSGNIEGLVQRASESGSRDLRVQTVLETMRGITKAPKDYLTFLEDQVKNIKVNTTSWGTDKKDIDAKVNALADDILNNYPHIYSYKDVDGQPLVTGKNEAEFKANLKTKLAKDLKERIKIDSRDPLINARFAASQKGKEDSGFTWEDLDQGVRQGEGKATSYLGGQKMPNGGVFEKAEFIKSPTAPYSNGYEVSYYGPLWGDTDQMTTDDAEVRRRTIILDERQWKELSFPMYSRITAKKANEGLKSAETIDDYVKPENQDDDGY